MDLEQHAQVINRNDTHSITTSPRVVSKPRSSSSSSSTSGSSVSSFYPSPSFSPSSIPYSRHSHPAHPSFLTPPSSNEHDHSQESTIHPSNLITNRDESFSINCKPTIPDCTDTITIAESSYTNDNSTITSNNSTFIDSGNTHCQQSNCSHTPFDDNHAPSHLQEHTLSMTKSGSDTGARTGSGTTGPRVVLNTASVSTPTLLTDVDISSAGGSRTTLEPESGPYPSFQSFFSAPSSQTERGISFEQMLMANSAVNSRTNSGTREHWRHGLKGESDSRIPESSRPRSRSTPKFSRGWSGSPMKPIGNDILESIEPHDNNNGNGNSNSNSTSKVVVDANCDPIPSPKRVGSPASDPSSIKTILSVAGVIPGTNREENEEECLDYQLKGRSRLSRGYSDSTHNWTTAQTSPTLDHEYIIGQRSALKPRVSTSLGPPGSSAASRSNSSEVLPLSEFLSQGPMDSPSRETNASPTDSLNQKMDSALNAYRLYNPPSSPPPPPLPVMLPSTFETGKVPITTATGEFSGYQQYPPSHRDAKYSSVGHSRMSSQDHRTGIAGSSFSRDTHPSGTDSGVMANSHHGHEEDDSLQQGKPIRNYKIFPGQNIFLCGGRIMTSRDFPAFIVAIMLLLVPTGLFHGFASPYLWNRLSPAVPIIQAYLFIITFSSMLKTSWTDPGVLPRGIDGDPPVDTPMSFDNSASFYPPRGLPRLKEVQVGMYTVRLKYCDTCKIYRPPRCSHCRQCDNCVEDEDHHCIWLNNCIGRRNYRYFLIFVTAAAIYALYTSAMCLTHLLLLYNDQKNKTGNSRNVSFQNDALAKAPASALVMIYAFIMGLAVGALASYHFWLATKNRTTHEQLSASMMGPHLVENPYDRGSIFANCVAVFCRPPTRSYIRRRDYTIA